MQLVEPVASPATCPRINHAWRARRAAMRSPFRRVDPRRFGRSPLLRTDAARKPPERSTALGYEFKLFAVTFLAGFLFISILLS